MKSNDYGTVSPSVNSPSAPPLEQPRETVTHVQGAAYEPQLQQTHHTQMVQQPPPPPYNEAINYPSSMPAAPPYPAYQPNNYQNVSAVVAPHMPQPNANTNGSPTVAYMMPATPVPTIINTTTIVPTEVPPARVNPCSHCAHGVVQSEADYCCLFCLLVFAVITFPFGLVLLLFIPLAFRRRCSACRHLYT